MNSYEYEVTISNLMPQPVNVVGVFIKVEAPNTFTAKRMVNNHLSVMFKGDPQLEWTYNLVNYNRSGS